MSFIDPKHAIESFGILGVLLIVFAESGLFIGFILPGDTLLFAAGLYAAKYGTISIWLLAPLIILAAVLGDNVGYTFGKKLGPKIFKKDDGILFRKEYIKRAEDFYQKHGGKTITFARFIPLVRTFAPMIAGSANMERKKFMLYNIAGAIVWGGGITVLGYVVKDAAPSIEKYIVPAMIFAMVVSFAGPIIHILRDEKARTAILIKLRLKKSAE